MPHVHTPTGCDIYLTPTGVARICFSYRENEPYEQYSTRWTTFTSQLLALGLEPASDEPDCSLMDETTGRRLRDFGDQLAMEGGLVFHDHYTLQRVPAYEMPDADDDDAGCACEVLTFPSATEESS